MPPDPRRLQRHLRRLTTSGTATVRRRPLARAVLAIVAIVAIPAPTSFPLAPPALAPAGRAPALGRPRGRDCRDRCHRRRNIVPRAPHRAIVADRLNRDRPDV